MKLHTEHLTGFLTFMTAGLVTVLLSALPGCSRHTETVSAAVTGQTSFSTPQEAGQALRAASKAHDETALTAILGPQAKVILSSGDPYEDKDSLDSFVSQYDRMNRWATMLDGSQILYIGSTNYPFPIPLVRNSGASWQFDAKAGEDEILARRIGRNELLAIDACYAVARAEHHYFKTAHDGNPAHQYTEKIISTPGKQDGLYWPVSADQPASPLGRVEEFAKDSVDAAYAGAPPVFDGYVFRILTSPQDGFTVIASPVKYGDSGIMTFILGPDGRVQQNDLGPDTSQRAAAIDTGNPTDGWTPAE
jgi:Protein of unknown function (DUF2950)